MAVRNMLTPRGIQRWTLKGLLVIEALFDCASRRTQESSAETVHEAAIAGSFLFWPLFLTQLFYRITVQRRVSKQLLINVFNLCVFLYFMRSRSILRKSARKHRPWKPEQSGISNISPFILSHSRSTHRMVCTSRMLFMLTPYL